MATGRLDHWLGVQRLCVSAHPFSYNKARHSKAPWGTVLANSFTSGLIPTAWQSPTPLIFLQFGHRSRRCGLVHFIDICRYSLQLEHRGSPAPFTIGFRGETSVHAVVNCRCDDSEVVRYNSFGLITNLRSSTPFKFNKLLRRRIVVSAQSFSDMNSSYTAFNKCNNIFTYSAL